MNGKISGSSLIILTRGEIGELSGKILESNFAGPWMVLIEKPLMQKVVALVAADIEIYALLEDHVIQVCVALEITEALCHSRSVAAGE